jgi:putative membrane protein
LTEFDPKWTQQVAAIEAESAAEVVLAVQPQAESYPEVAWKMATLTGLLTLVGLIHSPLVFHPDGVVLNVCMMGFFGFGLGQRFLPLRRMLCSGQRQERALQMSLGHQFEQLQVSHTRDRSGLLVLVSYFEQRALLKPDLGLQGRLSGAIWREWQDLLDGPGDLQGKVSQVLEKMKPLLASQMPRQADDVDELSNEVRFLC